jgi:hypothetical protein
MNLCLLCSDLFRTHMSICIEAIDRKSLETARVKAHEIVVHEVNRHHVRVMATVPANELLRRTFMANQDDPRMPAILDVSAWADWLGETDVTPDQAKELLKHVPPIDSPVKAVRAAIVAEQRAK